jgi:hypothetical protein
MGALAKGANELPAENVHSGYCEADLLGILRFVTLELCFWTGDSALGNPSAGKNYLNATSRRRLFLRSRSCAELGRLSGRLTQFVDEKPAIVDPFTNGIALSSCAPVSGPRLRLVVSQPTGCSCVTTRQGLRQFRSERGRDLARQRIHGRIIRVVIVVLSFIAIAGGMLLADGYLRGTRPLMSAHGLSPAGR